MALVLPEGKRGIQYEKILLGQVDRLGGLVVIAPARRARDPGSIPGPVKNFFLLIINIRPTRWLF